MPCAANASMRFSKREIASPMSSFSSRCQRGERGSASPAVAGDREERASAPRRALADPLRRSPASRRSGRRFPPRSARRLCRARSRRIASRPRAAAVALLGAGERRGAFVLPLARAISAFSRFVSPNVRSSRRCHGALRSSASSTAANSAESPIRTVGVFTPSRSARPRTRASACLHPRPCGRCARAIRRRPEGTRRRPSARMRNTGPR